MTTYAIAGAAGHLGRATTAHLLDRVDPSDVVLITRDPAKLADAAARGVAVRAGDFDDPTSLPAAFAGVDRLLVISTDGLGRRVEQHGAAFAAAAAVGVGYVAYTSIPNPVAGNPAGVVDEHRRSEELLQATPVGWTLLRNALYQEYLVPSLEQAIASGSFVTNYGDGKSAWVTRDDAAAVAAAWLVDAPAHAGRAYDVTGPELLGVADLVQRAGAAADAEPAVVQVDDDALVAGLVEHAELPLPYAELLASFGKAIREGALAQRTDVVAELTGRPATTVAASLAQARAGAAA